MNTTSLDPGEQLPGIPCWACGHLTRPYTPFRALENVGEDPAPALPRLPRAGDFTACAACGQPAVFEVVLGVLRLRELTERDAAALDRLLADGHDVEEP